MTLMFLSNNCLNKVVMMIKSGRKPKVQSKISPRISLNKLIILKLVLNKFQIEIFKLF